jgi:hypothetical protein
MNPPDRWCLQRIERARAEGREPSPQDLKRAAEIELRERAHRIDELTGTRTWEDSAQDFARARARSRWQVDDGLSQSRAPSPSADVNGDEVPELVSAGSGFRIRVAPSALTAIEREVGDAMWRFDEREVETGGYLYALYAPEPEGVRIVHASGPGPSSEHWRTKLRLSQPEQVRAAFPQALGPSLLLRVGDWHGHPVPDPVPSEADLKSWMHSQESAGVSRYVGLIVTPGREMGWMSPDFHGWVTRQDERGALVCEGAKVSEE